MGISNGRFRVRRLPPGWAVRSLGKGWYCSLYCSKCPLGASLAAGCWLKSGAPVIASYRLVRLRWHHVRPGAIRTENIRRGRWSSPSCCSSRWSRHVGEGRGLPMVDVFRSTSICWRLQPRVEVRGPTNRLGCESKLYVPPHHMMMNFFYHKCSFFVEG